MRSQLVSINSFLKPTAYGRCVRIVFISAQLVGVDADWIPLAKKNFLHSEEE
jgi:hypothetical protein